jgi:putative transposase
MTISLFQQIIKSLPRRKIDAIIATHGSDKWMKRFSTYDHLVAMIYAQLSGQTSLRDLEVSYNASPARHYHCGANEVKRSTLSDANAARPSRVFEAILSMLLAELGSKAASQAGELVQILDSTTIGLFARTHRAMQYRFNNSAIKLHLMFDADEKHPTWFQITPARFHDSKVCDDLPLASDQTYVFDRAYNNAAFWAEIDAAGSTFVTRPKSNLAYDVIASAHHPDTMIVADETIHLAGNPGGKYSRPLRRIEILDEENGCELAFITNDFDRDAEEVAALYKRRWTIELFFKWIKQNLKIKRFLARNPKAIRLQIITALIAYVLLKKLQETNRITIPLKRVAALASNYLFNLCDINQLIKPPGRYKAPKQQNQLVLNFPGQ